MDSLEEGLAAVFEAAVGHMVKYLSTGNSTMQKMRVVQVIGQLIRLGDMNINQTLGVHNAFSSLLALVNQSPQNNILHCQVEKVLSRVLQGGSNSLKISLLNDSDLNAFLADSYQKTTGSGHHGFLLQVASHLKHYSDENDQ